MRKILSLIFAALLSHPTLFAFDVYIFSDMEGCTQITNSKQVSGPEGAQRMTEDINVCISACFEAGATRVIVRDGHGSGINVDPKNIDPRAELIQGKTPYERFKKIDGCDAMILLGYHAKSLTPNAILAHSYSSKNIQALYLNGKEIGEIGMDAIIAAEHKVPVVLVQGADDACAEAREWIPGVVTCQSKKSTTVQSGKCLSVKKSHRRLARATKRALALRKTIPMVTPKYPATLRTEMVPKGSVRTHDPAYVRHPNPRFKDKTSNTSVEELLVGKPKTKK